ALLEQRQRLAPISGRLHLVAVIAEPVLHRFAHRAIVVHHQQPAPRSGHAGLLRPENEPIGLKSWPKSNAGRRQCGWSNRSFGYHHTLQDFLLTIGRPALHAKARANSGRSATMPSIRYFPGECGLVMALTRRFSGRWFSQAHCAKPMKNR